MNNTHQHEPEASQQPEATQETAEGKGRDGHDYRVHLEAYAGPMDLLLYLVKRHEIDLHNIPIGKLTDQYLHHLEVIRQLDIERAGEFLVMASTLLEIKSAMLMPRPEENVAEAEADAPETDPRFELVQQLLAYKKYKDAANALEARLERWEARYPVHVKEGKPEAEADDENARPIELDLEDVNILDLCEAFGRILSSIGQRPRNRHEVRYDETPIAVHAERIVKRLGEQKRVSLKALCEGTDNRGEMIGLFLATLELVREHKVKVSQAEASGEIELEMRSEQEQREMLDNQKEADWRNPETGEIEYDWPDEEAKKRAMRRQRLRATWAQKKADEEAGASEDDEFDDDREAAADVDDDDEDFDDDPGDDEDFDDEDGFDEDEGEDDDGLDGDVDEDGAEPRG